MAQRVLYREWRPVNFDEVVGQEHVVNALRQSVITGEIAHAYLFSGTRGTGKTSLAKIFARAINCQNPSPDGNPCNECEICRGVLNGSLLDVIEMDAASNNSVDNIRRITDEVLFMPTLAKYKVYIIDEVHMLSTAAFNALLKTLEEPPGHVVFILATTDPQRIPATVLSRCQRYDFKRIPSEQMLARLRLIADKNDITIDDEGLRTIVARSEGALRDAISLLDQSRSMYQGPIGREEILAMTGVVNDEFMEEIVEALTQGNADALLSLIDKLVLDGGDLLRFTTSLAGYFRDLLVCKTTRKPEALLQLPRKTIQKMQALAPLYSQATLIRQITLLSRLQQDMKQSASPRIALEVGLIQLLDQTKISEQDAVALKATPIQSAPQEPEVSSAKAASHPSPSPTLNSSAPPVRIAPEPEFKVNIEENTEFKVNIETATEVEEDDTPEPEERFPSEGDPVLPEEEDLSDADFFDEAEHLENSEPATPPAMPLWSGRVEPGALAEPAVAEVDELPVNSEPNLTDEVPSSYKFQTDDQLMFDLGREPRVETSGVKPAAGSETRPGAAPAARPSDKSAAESESDVKAETRPTAPFNMVAVWQKFIREYGDLDPLFAILVQNYPHRLEGQTLVIEVPAEHKTTYDTMKSRKSRSMLEEAFRKARPEGEWLLDVRLNGQNDEDGDSVNEPDWVKKMKRATKKLDIPLDLEE